MPRIRFVADVHIGNHKRFAGEVKSGLNDRCRLVLRALQKARTPAAFTGAIQARQDEDARLVVLGDLFDTSNPSPQVIGGTMQVLGYRTTLLLGNHDMVSMEPGDHALAPFTMQHRVVDEPLVVRESGVVMLMLPFRPEPMADWVAETIGSLLVDNPAAFDDDCFRVLCFHGGVRDHNTPKYLWASPDAIDVDLLWTIMERADIRYALCGNWHNHRRWVQGERTIVQVGALAPTGFDNPGTRYGYYVDLDTDTGTLEYFQVDQGPLFIVQDAATLNARDFIGKASRTHLKVRLGPDDKPEAIEAVLANYCLMPGMAHGLRAVVFEAHEVATDKQEAEAAEAARTADTLEGALREYVTAMPLPDGVERSVVEAKVLNYVARE